MSIKVRQEDLFIRKVQKSDVEELYALFKNLSEDDKQFFHPHQFDKQSLKKICNSTDDNYFVMILNNEIIGYSMLRFFGYEIPSFGIYIHRLFRNKGYGKFLTQWTLNRAKELEIEKVILKTYKNNTGAQHLYEKIGFKITGETDDKKQFMMEIKL